MRRRAIVAGALCGATLACASLEMGGVPSGRSGELSQATIAAGLAEALRVGTANAVAVTGTVDGFLRNQAIKILMPEQLRRLEQGMRALGFDRQVDEFIVSMNRAAERAVPHAKPIFLDAIAGLTFADARQILAGGDTAATDFFRARTEDRLAAAFRPIVEEATGAVGVTRRYKELTGQLAALPFLSGVTVDIDAYIVTEALDGLFHVLGEEERAIRHDPAARVTALLREVFGTTRR